MAYKDPEKQRAYDRERGKRRYATDPAFRERAKKYRKAWFKRRYRDDPAFRERYLARRRSNTGGRKVAIPGARLAWARGDRARITRALLAAYGGRCVCCDEAGPRFLTLDHVNGDGRVERAKGGGDLGWRRRLLRRLAAGAPDPSYRVLCFNCNIARNNHGRCHDASPLDQIPSPLPLPSFSSRGDAASGAASPQAAQLQLPTHAP